MSIGGTPRPNTPSIAPLAKRIPVSQVVGSAGKGDSAAGSSTLTASDAAQSARKSAVEAELSATSAKTSEELAAYWAQVAEQGGDQGPPGPEGPPGDAATIAVGTVTTGAAGSPAIVENSGTSSAAVLDFTIPRGANGADGAPGSKGEPGANGADGADGVPGAAATVSVGSVATGAPGTNAAVTNSGTANAAILNFTIPRGDTGTGGGGTTDPLDLVASDDTPVPPANTVRLHGLNLAGSMLPAFIGPSGLDAPLQPHLARQRQALWQALGTNQTTVTALGGAALTVVGATAGAAVTPTGTAQSMMRRLEYRLATAATSGVGGFRMAQLGWYRSNVDYAGGFRMLCRFGTLAGAAQRAFVGMSATASGTPTDAAINSLINSVGVGYDVGDTQWFAYFNNGSGLASRTALGVPVSTVDRADAFDLTIFCAPNGSSVGVELRALNGGEPARATSTTKLPVVNTLLAPLGIQCAGGVSSNPGIAFMHLMVESDG